MLYLYPYYLRAKNMIFMCSFMNKFFSDEEFEENKNLGFSYKTFRIKKITCASFIPTAFSWY